MHHKINIYIYIRLKDVLSQKCLLLLNICLLSNCERILLWAFNVMLLQSFTSKLWQVYDDVNVILPESITVYHRNIVDINML